MAGEKTSSQIQDEKSPSDDVPKKVELEKQIRKRVASEERAFRIVESLVDVTVSIERLKDMVHFILPAHYKDITEERAIAKFCGFPICKGQLGNVKKQKYQISTKTNRVYDITEKKNFCCSKCYKLSKIFEKQILESPLWSRESEKPAEFLLPDTETGWMGVEVIGQKIIDDSDDINTTEESVNKTGASSILDNRNWINELHETILGEKSLVFNESEKQETKEDLENVESLDVAIEDENQGFDLNDVSDFLGEQNSDDAVSDVSERLSTLFDSDDDPDTTVDTSPSLHHKKRSNSSQIDHLADGLSKVDISNEKLKNDSDAKVDYLKSILKCKKKNLSSFIGHVSSFNEDVNPPPPPPPLHPPTADITKNDKSQSGTASAITTPKNIPSASSESQKFASPQDKIRNQLHSWVTQESLEYLGVANTEGGDIVEDSKSDFRDSEFAKLCDRLDMRGLEFDELLEERLPQTVNPPKGNLPSYENLQKETASFSVKVKEYFKPLPKKKEEKTDASECVYVVPPVDSVSQITLRRSIVLQQLGKRMNSLLSPMNMVIGEISTEIKELVSTFKLQNDTITFKPAEWNVVGIFLIFMLSKKLEKLDIALQPMKVQDRYTKILSQFNLNFQEAQQILNNNILDF